MRLLSLLLVAAPLAAQSITGNIVGSVRDPSALPVPGASVTLKQMSTGAAREMKTDSTGDFRFTNLTPGAYSLSIKADGFKTAERTELMLPAAETLPVGDIQLSVGAVTETVSVVAQGAVVQTASSERSGVITSSQVENIQIRGRNVMSLLTLMPGVVSPNEPDLVTRAWSGNVNGNRTDSNSLSVDGMGLNQIGSSRNLLMSVSQDSVSEVKILLSNYQAEHGRYSGANVQVITKSGTRDFHGLFSYFKRHEQFNANSFFNNRLGNPKQRYRYNTWNYNVGGPVTIPGLFNKSRDKVFFFWSQEFWPIQATNAGRVVTMPTELERRGDFSRSIDQNGARINVVDPASRVAFPGNIVPASRIEPSGRAMLNIFPLPNFFDDRISAGRYNYVFNSASSQPQKLGTLKIDFNLHPKHQVFASYLFQTDTNSGFQAPAGGGANWNQTLMTYKTDPKQVVLRYQGVFSPTIVNELTVGVNGRGEWHTIEDADLAKIQRSKIGFTVGQLRPELNPFDVMPNLTFGGIPGPVNLIFDSRFPLTGSRMLVLFSDNLTKTHGKHIFKAGFSAERELTTDGGANFFNGNFDFSRNVNNPLDSGHPFANGLLGVFATYQEPTTKPFTSKWNTIFEWFVQDNWKVSRKLTLDIGARFYWIGARVRRFDLGLRSGAVRPFEDGGVDRSGDGRRAARGRASAHRRSVSGGGDWRSRARCGRCGERHGGSGVRQVIAARTLQHAKHFNGAAVWVCIRSVRQRQDGDPRRRGRVLQPQRYIFRTVDSTAAAEYADDFLRHLSEFPIIRRVELSARCYGSRSQSEKREGDQSVDVGAAGCRLWRNRRRRLCGQSRAQPVVAAEHQSGADGREFPALERRSDEHARSAAANVFAADGWLRGRKPDRVGRIVELSLDAGDGKPAVCARARFRVFVHMVEGDELRRRRRQRHVAARTDPRMELRPGELRPHACREVQLPVGDSARAVE